VCNPFDATIPRPGSQNGWVSLHFASSCSPLESSEERKLVVKRPPGQGDVISGADVEVHRRPGRGVLRHVRQRDRPVHDHRLPGDTYLRTLPAMSRQKVILVVEFTFGQSSCRPRLSRDSRRGRLAFMLSSALFSLAQSGVALAASTYFQPIESG
jgi:hypothetical protein